MFVFCWLLSTRPLACALVCLGRFVLLNGLLEQRISHSSISGSRSYCTRSFAFSIRVQSRSAFTVSRDTKPVRDIPVPLCFLLAEALFALSCCCAWPLAVPALLLLLFTTVCALDMMGSCFPGRRRWPWPVFVLEVSTPLQAGPAFGLGLRWQRRGRGCSWLHGPRPSSLL